MEEFDPGKIGLEAVVTIKKTSRKVHCVIDEAVTADGVRELVWNPILYRVGDTENLVEKYL